MSCFHADPLFHVGADPLRIVGLVHGQQRYEATPAVLLVEEETTLWVAIDAHSAANEGHQTCVLVLVGGRLCKGMAAAPAPAVLVDEASARTAAVLDARSWGIGK
jgi:hypothetical protein